MTSAREAFLQRVRLAVVEGNRAGHAHEFQPQTGIGYQGAADPVGRFAEELQAAGGTCHLAKTQDEAAEVVLRLVQVAGARKVLASSGLPRKLGVAARLRHFGLEVWEQPESSFPSSAWERQARSSASSPLPTDEAELRSVRSQAELGNEGNLETKEILFAADIGITGVDWLIAETGSMVMTTRAGQGRSLSLLPPVHIAVAERRQILPDLFDLFGAAGLEIDEHGPALPACVTLITGPSKTGDIELRLVTGVHGPGEVHVVLITEPRP